ncbi:MAG: DUF7221 family queuine tRNA-ribosyltransferase-like protein [Mesorhizobium sp.]
MHQPSDAHHFARTCISIRRLWGRHRPIGPGSVLIDSGAFTEINLHGGYRAGVSEYACELRRLHSAGVVNIAAAVSQDYMCEPFMLAKTGLTIADHQRLTIERYDQLIAELEGADFPVMPVLQGYAAEDYAAHLRVYGDRLSPGMWVGVGSVCKRNGSPARIAEVLSAIAAIRPDIRLHGFGIKQTSLAHAGVRSLLATADSMAWSFAARKQGRNGNSWQEAMNFVRKIDTTLSHQSAFRFRST